MSKINNTYWSASSDTAIVKALGAFIRYHRLEQNKTQSQLAEEAGINRTTLVEIEKGRRANIITFIQLLRSLNLLHLMEQFKVVPKISPLLLAEMEMKKRKRAGRRKNQTSKNNDPGW